MCVFRTALKSSEIRTGRRVAWPERARVRGWASALHIEELVARVRVMGSNYQLKSTYPTDQTSLKQKP